MPAADPLVRFTAAVAEMHTATEVLRAANAGCAGLPPPVARIVHAVAGRFDLHPHTLIARSRDYRVSLARSLAVLLCRESTEYTLTELGRLFGGRDHGTIIHVVKAARNAIETTRSTALLAADLRARLNLPPTHHV
jgi:chromosomal replication initiator protein